MRTLTALCFVICVSSIPNLSFAASHGKTSVADQAITTAKENPGATAGVAACGVAIAFFPPAALICGGTLAAGMVVDQTNK
jgi:hypothetical protein